MENDRKTNKAQADYIYSFEMKNYDRVLIRFPKGTKERIKTLGESVNGFTVSVVLDKLAQLEDFAQHEDM